MRRLLIANRGEIACRIIRTAAERGIETVAVYTDADVCAPHVAEATQAVRIGSGPVGDSYLDADKVLAAAVQSGADAVHPGYGFLSENADFAAAVGAAGLIWVGPPPEAIRAMGNKAEAKRLMIAAGVPCVPGYEGADQSDPVLIAEGEKIGFPLMVKAAAGGGGRGMRLVDRATDLPGAIQLARDEAQNAFGSGELILERAILGPRHVEVQVFADTHGTTVHLGERDCSVQRRHQKVLEEAPCPVLSDAERDAMGAAAVQAAEAIGYVGAGTVEFLRDASGDFYFLEMNTRLQVEHPVTEAVTGLDLVALQLDAAIGKPLGFTQNDVTVTGHAIEARLYAEDPADGFKPSTGKLSRWIALGGAGIRVDSGVVEGIEISPFYDPMLAKIIAHGATREEARNRLARGLRDLSALGITTNRDFLIALVKDETFAAGQATTALIGDTFPDGFGVQADDTDRNTAAQVWCQAAAKTAMANAAWVPAELMGWSSSATAQTRVPFADGAMLVTPGKDPALPYALTEDALWLTRGDKTLRFALETFGVASLAAPDRITAPMAGAITAVYVSPGDIVAPGDPVAVIEAMKMQQALSATMDGRVTEVAVATGAQVPAGALIVKLEAPDATS
ncbi:MAG: biotin carboxylase N-terminal domain-containing protein [Pseudomonadota bacterium]